MNTKVASNKVAEDEPGRPGSSTPWLVLWDSDFVPFISSRWKKVDSF